MSKIILGLQIDNRFKEVSEVQKILTDYGCIIKTRLGLHQQIENNNCTEKGLIILELTNNCGNKCSELEEKLSAINGVIIRKMEFPS
ncbi:hypothetical protein SAMN02745135_01856 [Caloranaerobacter azorensis DSM 13643]|uniref:Iron-only hydrogenase system regulator n=1 Tax=Caloranaerobacter azorensis DSM 13643 TaxID=1121264 RepID=A0A1M5VCV5_9FIRM|nr:hypothetical protein [Caloranaerobacter azorensis]SHH72753.1 hypothetical protein SAMN02745135_01856 [Caloranaerobacter azorensis DSM 13643]